ncbi:MAG: 30S ribosomal protein S12 methylthiotransferase RimO [Bradymonadia bacterium]
MTAKRVHILSLGCPKNRVDAETMLAKLPGDAYTLTPNADDADVVVVNTCAFVESAKVESIDAILEMVELKQQGKVEQLLVTGCLAQRYPEDLAREMPEVDYFVGTNDLGRVNEALGRQAEDRILVGSPDRLDFDWEAPRQNSMPGYTTYLKVAEGCSNKCAFCIIPTLRGPQRSRSIESIVQEAIRLSAAGVKELNLIAQDLTAYGYDLKPRTNLTALLEALEAVGGIRWIRLYYAYPRSFPKGLVDLMARSKKVVPYLDMPLQHISDSVLKGMRRGTNGDMIRRRVMELRERVPGLVLRTTMLVGYPGETDADFRQLLDFIKEARFDRLGAFAYSREEGTPSHDLPDQVPDEIKEARLDELMYVQRDIAREINAEMVGREVEVLVEGPSEESDLLWVGRTAQQAPEIDGTTYLSAPIDLKPGMFVKGVVTQATDYDLVVEVPEAVA